MTRAERRGTLSFGDHAVTARKRAKLLPKREQHALTLSSGETQRLGIARALVLDPEILFLDEPTASVDEENTEIIESIVGAMKNQGRLTVIMATHDRVQAERIADRLLIMKHGRIEEGVGK